jgi:ABC-2 type transport system permease protein
VDREDEGDRTRIQDWPHRALSKLNYRIHTDAIQERLIPPRVTPAQATMTYASEADMLNVALFGHTATEWRNANSEKKGNVRDHRQGTKRHIDTTRDRQFRPKQARQGWRGPHSICPPMIGLWKEVAARRELLAMLVVRNIKIRYKDSVLGFFWTLLGPLLLILIYAVFLGILKIPVALPVLVTGIFVWQYLAMCLGDSAQAIIGSSNLVKKAAFPRITLPLAVVLANFVNFLLSLVVVVAYTRVAAVPFGPVIWLPLALVTQVALCLGVSLILAALNVFFRDVQHLIGVATMAWFFLTPVIYDAALVEHVSFGPLSPFWLKFVFYLNPMTGLLALYRTALIGSPLPDLYLLVPSLALGWGVCVAGVAIFMRLQGRFADEL